MTRTICLHGPESTGKSTIAPRLAARLGGAVVDEYGRTYAEANGTDFTMADLVAIAKGHDARTREVIAKGIDPVILDTDPLMTAVWADMLFGTRDPWFDAWQGTADLYLLFDIDLPWIDDGTRMFGTVEARQRFFDLSKAELIRRGVLWTLVSVRARRGSARRWTRSKRNSPSRFGEGPVTIVRSISDPRPTPSRVCRMRPSLP